MMTVKKTVVWAIIIFLFSSIFRLSNFDLIEFKSDEATTVFQTVKFFDNPYLIERGLISGTGVYNFPLFNYVMIPLSLWSRDPLVLSGTIALVNSLLVVLFFLLIKKYYGLLTAVFACLLLAFSPWGVLFSRKIWAQDLIFLFLIPFFWLLHELILRKNSKVVLPLFLLLTLLVQLHGSGFFLSVATILILLIMRIRVNLKSAAYGVLIGLIPAIPYFLFQINAYPPCPDCEAFFKYQQSARAFDFYNFLRPFQITGGLGYHFILGKSYADFINAFPAVNLLKYVFASGFFVILAGIFFIIIKRRQYLYLVIYFVTIPFLYFVTKTTAYMHYFVIIIPVSILLFAIVLGNVYSNFANTSQQALGMSEAVKKLARRDTPQFNCGVVYSLLRNKFLKISVLAYFLFFLSSNIIFLVFFYDFIAAKKQIEGDYGPIYSLTKSLLEKETKR